MLKLTRKNVKRICEKLKPKPCGPVYCFNEIWEATEQFKLNRVMQLVTYWENEQRPFVAMFMSMCDYSPVTHYKYAISAYLCKRLGWADGKERQ